MIPIHVIRDTGGLGDMICCFPALDGLRRMHPLRPIVLHAPSKYEPLVGHGQCWGMDRPDCKFVPTERLLRPWRGAPLYEDFRRSVDGDVVDLHGPEIAHENTTEGSPSISRVQLWCDTARVPISFPHLHPVITERSWRITSQWNAPPVLLHPQARATIRRWDLAQWLFLSCALTEAGYHIIWIMDSADEIGETARGDDTLVGVPFDTLPAIFLQAGLLIGVDSGPFHLAAAVGTPALGLFGSTDGALTIGQHVPGIAHHMGSLYGAPGTACMGPCYAYAQRGFRGYPCLSQCRAMVSSILPQEVFQRAVQLMSRRGFPRCQNAASHS